MSKSDKPLWKCPKCGHEFVTQNLWHSCGRYSLADHFEDSDPKVRELFDRFTGMVEACGPVTIYPEQTRIVCQVRVRFAGVVPRRRDLDVGVWLTRPAQHPKLRRTELIPPSTFVHHFRFKQPAELDDAFMTIVREGYAVGRQEHLERAPRKPRRRQRKSGEGKRVPDEKQPASGESPQQEQKATASSPQTGAASDAPKQEKPQSKQAPAKKRPARKRKPARRTSKKGASKKGTTKKAGDKKPPAAQRQKKEKPKPAKKDAS
jgi:hypothetical protein